MDRNQWLTEIAQSIADGHAVDWVAAGDAALGASESEILRRLQSIEQLIRAHGFRDDGHAPGTSWGHLKILGTLGTGTHGDVYRAYDERLDRDVALKLLRSNHHLPYSAVVDEARLMAKVRHPNVAVVYGADTIGGKTGIWMELIDGRSLAERVQRDGPFAPNEVVRIGVDVCNAVTAINKAGLLHRDIKAQNVLLENTGRVVIADFSTGQEDARALNAGGVDLVGTPAYLAPEVLAGAAHSPRSEVYALGALLYYIASGAFPANGRSLAEIRHVHQAGRSISAAAAIPALPVEIGAAIESALEREPAKRYFNSSGLRRALQSAQSIRGQRLPGFVLSLVASADQRTRIAKVLIAANVEKRRRSLGRLGRAVVHLHSWATVAWAVIVAGIAEIPLISWSWAVRAYLWLAMVPGCSLYFSNWVITRGLFHSDLNPLTFACAVFLWSAWVWKFFLPFSFFYATALPFRSRLTPVAALVVSGSGLAFLLESYVYPTAWITAARAHAQASDYGGILEALWNGLTVNSLEANLVRTFRVDRISFIRDAASATGLLLLVPAMTILGAQLRRAPRRSRRAALWLTPILSVVASLAFDSLHRKGEFSGQLYARHWTNWIVAAFIATFAALYRWSHIEKPVSDEE